MESLFAFMMILMIFGIASKMFKSIFYAVLFGLILSALLIYFGVIRLI